MPKSYSSAFFMGLPDNCLVKIDFGGRLAGRFINSSSIRLCYHFFHTSFVVFKYSGYKSAMIDVNLGLNKGYKLKQFVAFVLLPCGY